MDGIRKRLCRLTLDTLEFLEKNQYIFMGEVMVDKGDGDIATKGDLLAESYLIEALEKLFPHVPVLSEESASIRTWGNQVLVVDPLDGTTNYFRGQTHFSVAVALLEGGAPQIAAAAVGERHDSYSAIKGRGAYWGNEKIGTSPKELGPLSLVSFQSNFEGSVPHIVHWLLVNGPKIRNYGSTVSHLCQIAHGRMDLCILDKAKVWDFAASGLILQEAGGYLSDQGNKPLFPIDTNLPGWETKSYSLIASNGKAHENLPPLN